MSSGGASGGGSQSTGRRRSSTSTSTPGEDGGSSSSPPFSFDSLTRLFSTTNPRDLSPQSRKNFQGLRSLSRRVTQHQTKKKLEFAFHLHVHGIIPLFVLQNNATPINITQIPEIYQRTFEPTREMMVFPQVVRFPFRTIREFGVLNSGGNRTTLEWKGLVPRHLQRLQRIFKNDDRNVQWTQLKKNQFRQIVGPMNQHISQSLLAFLLRHVDPRSILQSSLGNIQNNGYLSANANFTTCNSTERHPPLPWFGVSSGAGGYMMTGVINLTLGFHTMEEVMRCLEHFRYDFFTFYPQPGVAPDSRITISFRDKLDPRGDYIPLYDVENRSWISSDFALLLSSYIQRKETMRN